MSLHLASAPREGDDRPRSGPQRYVPFSEHLGLKVERAEGGESLVSVVLRPELLNNHASGHGGVLQAQGRATGGGRSVCFCEATVTDADGEVAARAMGTFRYRDIA